MRRNVVVNDKTLFSRGDSVVHEVTALCTKRDCFGRGDRVLEEQCVL